MAATVGNACLHLARYLEITLIKISFTRHYESTRFTNLSMKSSSYYIHSKLRTKYFDNYPVSIN